MSQTLLFTRLTAIAQREGDDIKQYFTYEMTTEPLGLFKHGLMRKPDKPALWKVLMPDHLSFSQQQIPESIVFIIDGGALLHRVCWVKDITFGELAQHYVNYAKKHHGSCFIIFNDYELKSTKASEHKRRSGCSPKCPNISIQECNKVPYTQDRFLSNESNKAQLIRLYPTNLDGMDSSL